MLLHAGLLKIFGYHFGAGGQGCFNPGLNLKPFRHRVLRQQARTQHHRRVGSVSA